MVSPKRVQINISGLTELEMSIRLCDVLSDSSETLLHVVIKDQEDTVDLTVAMGSVKSYQRQ